MEKIKALDIFKNIKYSGEVIKTGQVTTMECVQIIVKIESKAVIDLLKAKGQELGNLISLHGSYAIFAGESTFSWKWLASNLSFMVDTLYDVDCIEYWRDNNNIVAALWQHDGDEAMTKWYLCDGCSDDFIDDSKVHKIVADVITQTDVVKFPFNRQEWLNARAKKSKTLVASNKIIVPSREQITRAWLLALTPTDWKNISLGDINYKILDEWENPIYKQLQDQYKGYFREFNELALKAIQEGKGWAGVESIKAMPKPKLKLIKK